MEKVTIGDCTLYHGDALEILPDLEKSDCCATDPPYKLERGGKGNSGFSGKLHKSKYNNSGSIVECNIDWSDFMPPIYAALKGNAHAYFMANNRHVSKAQNAA